MVQHYVEQVADRHHLVLSYTTLDQHGPCEGWFLHFFHSKTHRHIREEIITSSAPYFPGITDIVVVADPAEIRTISNDSRFDRDFITIGVTHGSAQSREGQSG